MITLPFSTSLHTAKIFTVDDSSLSTNYEMQLLNQDLVFYTQPLPFFSLNSMFNFFRSIIVFYLRIRKSSFSWACRKWYSICLNCIIYLWSIQSHKRPRNSSLRKMTAVLRFVSAFAKFISYQSLSNFSYDYTYIFSTNYLSQCYSNLLYLMFVCWVFDLHKVNLSWWNLSFYINEWDIIWPV